MPNQFRKGVKEFLAIQANFVVAGADMSRNLTGVRQFAVSCFAVANRESFDLLSANLAGKRSDDTRVQAAA